MFRLVNSLQPAKSMENNYDNSITCPSSLINDTNTHVFRLARAWAQIRTWNVRPGFSPCDLVGPTRLVRIPTPCGKKMKKRPTVSYMVNIHAIIYVFLCMKSILFTLSHKSYTVFLIAMFMNDKHETYMKFTRLNKHTKLM